MYYFLDDIIKTNNFDPNKIKINSVNPLYLIFSKVNECFEEINKNRYLVLMKAKK